MGATALALNLKPTSYISDIAPVSNSIGDLKPPVTIVSKTTAQLYDPGITFNEPGITFNEPGIAFGGVYGAQGYVTVMNATARRDAPSNNHIVDFPGENPTPPPPTGNSGMLVGILGMTYP